MNAQYALVAVIPLLSSCASENARPPVSVTVDQQSQKETSAIAVSADTNVVKDRSETTSIETRFKDVTGLVLRKGMTQEEVTKCLLDYEFKSYPVFSDCGRETVTSRGRTIEGEWYIWSEFGIADDFGDRHLEKWNIYGPVEKLLIE